MGKSGVQLIGVDKVLKRFDQFKAKANSQIEIKQRIATAMLADVNNQFATGGPGWAPLDSDTIKRKGGRGGILYRTGAYAKSWKPRFGSNFVDVFSKLFYNRFHQNGEGGVPKRDVKLSADVKQKIFSIFRLAFTFKAS
jgi:phage gpG-like protein